MAKSGGSGGSAGKCGSSSGGEKSATVEVEGRVQVTLSASQARLARYQSATGRMRRSEESNVLLQWWYMAWPVACAERTNESDRSAASTLMCRNHPRTAARLRFKLDATLHMWHPECSAATSRLDIANSCQQAIAVSFHYWRAPCDYQTSSSIKCHPFFMNGKTLLEQ